LRKPATILLLTIFCNSLFYYGYFSYSILKAKLNAKVALAKIRPQDCSDILKVPVSRLQKDESDEAWFDGKLYDVAERDRINDTVYVFLLRDEEEQGVLYASQRYFQGTDAFSGKGHEMAAIRIPPASTDTEQPQDYRLSFWKQVRLIRTFPATKTSTFSSLRAETPTPPPKRD
jgi:hypothetical protein